jgi:hypothetical protein
MQMPKFVPLNELEVAVQSAVEQALGKAGAVPIDKLWVGFVAPENIATQQLANEIATKVGGPGAVGSVGSVGQQTGRGHKDAIQNVRIIGYIHQQR